MKWMLALLLFPLLAPAQSWRLVWHDEFTNAIGSDWTFESGNGNHG